MLSWGLDYTLHLYASGKKYKRLKSWQYCLNISGEKMLLFTSCNNAFLCNTILKAVVSAVSSYKIKLLSNCHCHCFRPLVNSPEDFVHRRR